MDMGPNSPGEMVLIILVVLTFVGAIYALGRLLELVMFTSPS